MERNDLTDGIATETLCNRRGRFRVFYRRDRPVDELLEDLLPDPDRVVAGGEICKRGSRNHSVRITLAGRNFFLKRYNFRGWGYRFGSLFRQSRAVRTWKTHLQFRKMGLPIQEPILCLEQRKCRFLGRSYLLTEFVDHSTPLVDIWPSLDVDEKQDLLSNLAKQLGRMHRSGGIHGDLKWYNILIRHIDSELAPVLVDLDGGRVMRGISERKMRADIERFLRDLEIYESDVRLKELFLKAWHDETCLT